MNASYESNLRTQEIAEKLFDVSCTTSHYKVIDNVLVRISNHLPNSSNLEMYNDVDSLDGVLFIFIKDNNFDFESEIEKMFGDDFNYRVVEVLMDEDFNQDDLIWNIKKTK